jgi:hypothetical protein
MSEIVNHVCYELTIPPEDENIARKKAIEQNYANATPFEAAADYGRLWPIGKLLRVKFINGIPAVQRKVAFYAAQWSQYANIKFTFFVNEPDAEIRITFNKGDSYSAVGTDALAIPLHGETMNYGWLPAPDEKTYSSVVLHEFGHALGLIHEHQNPGHPIQWNEQAVIAYFSGHPNYWSEKKIRREILNRAKAGQTASTSFDPRSIMVYPIAKAWTLDGLEVSMNHTLSQTDKDFIRTCYPF